MEVLIPIKFMIWKDTYFLPVENLTPELQASVP